MKNKRNTIKKKSSNTIIEDDTAVPVKNLIVHRLPWLILGLFAGIFATIIVSKYEAILSGDVRLAFYIPIIVYMSDAVGTQTETIVIRHMKKNGIKKIKKHLIKEFLLGLGLGIIFGGTIGLFTFFWLHSFEIALTVSLAMLISIIIAPVVATIMPILFFKAHRDPALGSGPIATVIQDLLSLIIYFVVATFIIF